MTDDGKAWVNRSLKLYVVGENPKIPALELNCEVEKQISEYCSGNVAGISPEFTHNEVVSGIH